MSKLALLFAQKMASEEPPSAGLIIIGDEILKGRVQDANSVFLARELWGAGVRTRRILTIPDSVREIADSVRAFSKEFDYVLTTGGVGPTHDDVTFEGVARGMDRELTIDSQLIGYLRRQGMGEQQAAESKMASIPMGAEVFFGSSDQLMSWFPLVRVGNVFVLPGIPSYVRAIWQHVSLGPGKGVFHSGEVYLRLDETVFARELGQLQGRWEGRVEIGSYPASGEEYATKLTVDSAKREWTEACLREIRADLYPDWQLAPREEGAEVCAAETRDRAPQESPEFPARLQEALSILSKLLVMYSEEEVCVAFNGGKDCTVLLDLLKRCLRRSGSGPERLRRVLLLYLRTGDTFPEMERFIRETSERNRQQVVRMEGGMRECLVSFSSKYPRVKAILMGTRQLDPSSEGLHPFQSTDRDWPNFLRVMPILSWSYREVWGHLRGEGVPYCPLYDQGYTSVGEAGSTGKNPALRIGESGDYRPAYQLEEERREREGRDKRN